MTCRDESHPAGDNLDMRDGLFNEDLSCILDSRIKPLMDAINLGIVIVDDQGKVVLANKRAAHILGCDQSKIVGAFFGKFVVENLSSRVSNIEDLVNWLEIEKRVMDFSIEESLRPSYCELKLTNDNGHLLIHASPVNSQGLKAPSKAQVFVLEDISEEKRKEEILEMVSLAARELNRDLHIQEMLSHLKDLVSRKIPCDAMAIISIGEDGKGQVIGAIPDSFLGGVGARGPLGQVFDDRGQRREPEWDEYRWEEESGSEGVTSVLEDSGGFSEPKKGTVEPGSQFLVDIVRDIAEVLSAPSFDEPPSMFPKSFLKELQDYGMTSMIALPLTVFSRISGIWVITSKKPGSYSVDDLILLEPLSEHLSVAIHNSQLLKRTKEMYTAAVKALAATVDIRDAYTMHHSEHVATIAGIIARGMGLPKDEVDIIELAGLVHDIGKVGIPDAVLQKPGPLDPSERAVMTNHSVLGATILERAGMLKELAPMVLHHHEWHNGSGYPDRLKGESIPLGASILSVADAFDTMISDRVYRRGMPLEQAREELRRCAGGQFNPAVVAVLEKAIDEAIRNKSPWLFSILEERKGKGEFQWDLPRTLVEQEEESAKTITSKELGVFFKITQEMRKLLDLKELLNHILQILAQDMGYSDCVILMPDEKGENLVISASIGMSRDLLGIKIPKGTGISWWVMEHGEPQNVPDVRRDDRYYEGIPGVGSELYIPLDVRGERQGVLLVQKREVGGFSDNDERLLLAVAGHIASALEVAQLHEQVKKAADTDALTGLYNRRKFFSVVQEMCGGTCEEDVSRMSGASAWSIAIIDVDCLKAVNDSYGHIAGDQVLIEIAKNLSKGYRVCDVVARYGGDEFVVFLPGASHEATEKRTKDIIESWRNKTLMTPDGREIPTPSASYGVASSPEDGQEVQAVLTVADNRLLQAKPTTRAARYCAKRENTV